MTEKMGGPSISSKKVIEMILVVEDDLRGFAYKLTKDHQDAQDLYQETVYRILNNIDKYKKGTKFRAWTTTIMRNAFINNYRKKGTRRKISDYTGGNLVEVLGESIKNRGEGNILLQELEGMVSSLPDEIRIPFEMHFQGYKYQEIVDHFGLPMGTIKSRIFFARKKLKAEIQKKYPDGVRNDY